MWQAWDWLRAKQQTSQAAANSELSCSIHMLLLPEVCMYGRQGKTMPVWEAGVLQVQEFLQQLLQSLLWQYPSCAAPVVVCTKKAILFAQ